MKVIDIRNDGELILIGLDNGGIREIAIDSFNYTPKIGDEVEIFESKDTIVVSKKDTTGSTTSTQSNPFTVNTNVVYENVGDKVLVNKWVYVLLAFFFGYIGIHKFYVGKIGLGVIYLLFFWTGIPAIIAFIECIVAIFAEADANGNILV